MDYVRNASEKPIQEKVFERQCKCAVEANLPLIVHSRGAAQETFDILDRAVPNDWKIHLHCFADNAAYAEKVVTHFPNLFIGVTGNVTFEDNKKLRLVVKQTPLERILIETGMIKDLNVLYVYNL